MNSGAEPVTRTVGIVVPTLGERYNWLRDCVASIVAQDVNKRILIVGPESANLRRIEKEFQVDFLVRPANGLSSAINAGFERFSDHEFVSWLGDDDILAPDALRLTIEALTSKPAANFAYGNTRYIDGGSASIYCAPSTRFAPYYMRIGKDFVPQPGSLFRTSALMRRRPPLDPGLKNAMDLELFLRLSEGGSSKWAYVNAELSAYRLHETAITANKSGIDESEKVRAKFYPRGWSLLARPLRPIRMFGEKAIVWLQWRLCKPPIPTHAGVPYTSPGAYMNRSNRDY